MSSATLTSLAILKVNIDQGKDYLDYLRPFVMQVLVDHRPDPITDSVVTNHLRNDFGLEIPERTIQIVLKRLARKHPLKRETGVYRITGDLPDPGIVAEKSKAERHINAVVTKLIEFSKTTAKPIATNGEAITAICAFLSQFNIPCLRAYLRGTAIPTIEGNHDVHITIVSRYALHLQQADPERFDSFMVLVQGHMLANALLCPDLNSAPRTYKGVTCFLDTPMLVRLLGLEGESKQIATKTLIELLDKLGATVATFTHSRDELEKVLEGAAKYVDSPNGRGTIVTEARRGGTTKSDLLLLAGQIDKALAEARVQVSPTPPYIAKLQIDEKAFEDVLDDEVSYFNPRAKEYDINSVRSIYVLRQNSAPRHVEKSRAILVTSNSGFARAAYKYGQQYEASREVSTVITDFSLANMAWLKAPMGASSLPTAEVLAISYAALQPSQKLLDKYLTEIDKLEKQGEISETDHQLLRSSTFAHRELMHLTMGDEDALTPETVTETLERVSREIKKEESTKLTTEQMAHRKTQVDLAQERLEKERIRERMFWRCRKRANGFAWCLSVLLAILLVAGLASGVSLVAGNSITGWALCVGSGILIVLTFANLLFGTTVTQLHQSVQDRCQTWLLKRESAATGLDLENRK